MHPQNYPAELRRLGGLLTGPEISDGGAWAACEQLLQLFLAASGLEMSQVEMRQDLALPSGKALAPAWAAFCIKDYQRTRTFLRGILQAIRTARQSFTGQIHVLYAGAGPFATLVMPLIPLLEEEDVVFTLLDIHRVNLESLKKVATVCRVSEKTYRLVLADATSYQAERPAHLIVVEMMQAGLQQEPQVAAMLNLAPQLLPGGMMIPQEITVEAGLFHPRRDHERMMGSAEHGDIYRLLGPVMQLSVGMLEQYRRPTTNQFPEIILDFPAERAPGFRQLALFTTIEVFGNERLDVWDSVLTQPLVLTELPAEMAPKKLWMRYQLGAEPGFRWRIV